MLYRISDPVAKTDTRWDSSSNEVKVIHWPESAPEELASKTQCATACYEDTMSAAGTVIEKLGTKTLGAVSADGTRTSYTVPAGQDHNNQPIVVVHERWYCEELRVVILETNDDPRSGTSTDELVDILRSEPDVTKYLPPADYIVHDINYRNDGRPSQACHPVPRLSPTPEWCHSKSGGDKPCSQPPIRVSLR